MRKILLAMLAVAMGLSFIATPVFAAQCGDVQTSIIDCKGEDGIDHILGLVVDIMTIGIGILGVIGISIVGIQYLTAGGNEEKTRKAKRRMLEIIIGLAVFVVFRAILAWLGVGSGISSTPS